MSEKMIKTPDLGGDEAYPVVEILANVGDEVAIDDPILLLESDKATMEVPSTIAGTLTEILVSVGDTLKTDDVVAKVNTNESSRTNNEDSKKKAASPSKSYKTETMVEKSKQQTDSDPTHSARPSQTNTKDIVADIHCETVVLGSGPGGYSAAFRSADLGMDTVLIEKYSELGGVCLNVGCIPSKALLHSTHILEEAQKLGQHGISFGKPKIDLGKIRAHKDDVIGQLTKGIAGMAKMRKVKVIQGYGNFSSANTIEVEHSGKKQVIAFEKAIIACGSRPINLPFLPEDDRIIDSTGALELADIPKHMLVIGGGIIGMEMATVYSALGAKLSVVELSPSLMPGADADLVKVWTKENKHRFEEIRLEEKVIDVEAIKKGIEVTFEDKKGNQTKKTYDKVLTAVGRSPNGKLINAQAAGVTVDDRGFIAVDSQMRTNISHIFAIGDVVGQPMLAHKAVHEAHVAAEAAHGEKSHFDAKVIPSVAYTFPEIAFVGLTETEAKKQAIKYQISIFPWAASGKAISKNAQSGFVKLLFDPNNDRLLGGSIVGDNAGDLISEVCLGIEMGANATDIGKTIHPHPTLGESVGMAAENLHGHCTDLPPKKK